MPTVERYNAPVSMTPSKAIFSRQNRTGALLESVCKCKVFFFIYQTLKGLCVENLFVMAKMKAKMKAKYTDNLYRHVVVTGNSANENSAEDIPT